MSVAAEQPSTSCVGPADVPFAMGEARPASRTSGWLDKVALLVPWAGVLLFDALHRGRGWFAVIGSQSLPYLGTALASLVVWASLLVAIARSKGWLARLLGLVFVLGYALVLGGQRYFFEQYRTFVSGELGYFASDFLASIRGQLWADLAHYLLVLLPYAVFASALVWLVRRRARPRYREALGGVLAATLIVLGWLVLPAKVGSALGATPDVLYLDAAKGLVSARWGKPPYRPEETIRPRHSLTVPTLHPHPARPRNVLMVIVESTRADSACTDHDPNCVVTRYSNELTPQRFGLIGMHAVDTVTSTSLAVLTAGFGPQESVEVMHSWPLLFDYARAAGYDAAFWTSQNLDFGKSRLWVDNLGVSRSVSATELDPKSDIDMGADERLLAARVASDLDRLREPFLGVVQLSNVHHPYWVARDLPQPFQPARFSKAEDEHQEFFNHYRNAVHQEDYHVATILRHLRTSERGQRTVVVYTADHGEAFREHGLLGHSLSLYEEELHVPAWIDAPGGLLAPEEQAALRDKHAQPTYHLDLVPTMLDLMGVWDDPGIGLFKERLPGKSLLRPGLIAEPVPLTNCTVVWGCAFENWGVMQGSMKLIARVGDSGWRCFDLARDPRERTDLGPAACGSLARHATDLFHRLPGQ